MPLRIDIVSDMICPWCLIGTRQLYAALAKHPEVEATISFHPFELDATTPREGRDLRESLRSKFGVDPETMFGRVEDAARKAGIPLDFSKVRRSPKTLPAHVLAQHAAEKGTQRDLVDALFEAYFLRGEDLGDPSVLAAIGSNHGFSADEAIALVTDEQELAKVRDEAAKASKRGVRGVPFFIFNDELAVSGAQPVEVFEQVFVRMNASSR